MPSSSFIAIRVKQSRWQIQQTFVGMPPTAVGGMNFLHVVTIELTLHVQRMFRVNHRRLLGADSAETTSPQYLGAPKFSTLLKLSYIDVLRSSLVMGKSGNDMAWPMEWPTKK